MSGRDEQQQQAPARSLQQIAVTQSLSLLQSRSQPLSLTLACLFTVSRLGLSRLIQPSSLLRLSFALLFTILSSLESDPRFVNLYSRHSTIASLPLQTFLFSHCSTSTKQHSARSVWFAAASFSTAKVNSVLAQSPANRINSGSDDALLACTLAQSSSSSSTKHLLPLAASFTIQSTLVHRLLASAYRLAKSILLTQQIALSNVCTPSFISISAIISLSLALAATIDNLEHRRSTRIWLSYNQVAAT